MDKNRIAEIVEAYRETLAHEIQVAEVIVFGSYLEGDATDESDLDLIVVSNDFAPLSEDERLDILEQAAEETEPMLHPWGFTTQEVAEASRLTTLGYARDAGLHFR